MSKLQMKNAKSLSPVSSQAPQMILCCDILLQDTSKVQLKEKSLSNKLGKSETKPITEFCL